MFEEQTGNQSILGGALCGVYILRTKLIVGGRVFKIHVLDGICLGTQAISGTIHKLPRCVQTTFKTEEKCLFKNFFMNFEPDFKKLPRCNE